LVANKIIYIIKIQGKARIPDYVQIRDGNYTLLAYFRADRPEKALAKCGLEHLSEKIMERVHGMPFGKLEKMEI
jgi:hypothetical protein